MEYVLTFGSTSHAIRAEQVLLDAGLAVAVMPLPAAIRAGCGLCLRIGEAGLPGALAALAEAAVPIEEIFIRTARGGAQAYTPYEEEATS